MKTKQKKYYHLGMTSITNSTIARMNEQESCDGFKQIFMLLLHRCKAFNPHSKFEIKGIDKLMLMDSTLSD